MSRIIAIASGKGGVGKTWLAVTLGHALARLGRRVLVFDGDLGLANIDVQLGLEPGADLGTVLTGRCRLHQAVRRFEPCGFDLLPGRSGSGRLGAMEPARLGPLLDELQALARAYDVTLLDLPAGIDGIVRRLLATAGGRLVITTDEPTALTDAYALIKAGRVDAPAGELELAVNLAASRDAGQRTHAGLARVCRRFLGLELPLAGILRRDPRVVDAIRHQAPLLAHHPLAPAAKDVEALARHVAGRG